MTHKERYNKAVEIIGIEKIREYYPIKTKEEVLKTIKDKHLNGILLVKFDRTFTTFMNRFYYSNKKELNELGINGSPASWVCILKNSMMTDFGLHELSDSDFENNKYVGEL